MSAQKQSDTIVVPIVRLSSDEIIYVALVELEHHSLERTYLRLRLGTQCNDPWGCAPLSALGQAGGMIDAKITSFSLDN